MNVKQIYELANNATKEALGDSALLTEDLSNIVDIGTALFNANAVDNYVRSLVNHIGKVIFVNRPYRGAVPSVLMDKWEFGSVLEKIAADIPEATENESWELQNGTSYDPNVFYKPAIEAKFYNSKCTFEIDISITDKQVRESFSGPEQLNGFISMIYNAVDKSMTVKLDALVMRTINSFIAETANESTGTTPRKVNLLADYKTETGDNTLTAAKALTSPEFIRFASYKMGLYRDRLGRMSRLFNIGGKARFTPADVLHVVMLSDFAKAADAYLQSDTYHNELTRLPNAETVPYWQGSGTGYDFDSVATVKVKTHSGDEVTVSGVLAVMFDRDALGVCNGDRRVTTAYNAKAEFYTNFNKWDAMYYNDLNENFVYFFIAD